MKNFVVKTAVITLIIALITLIVTVTLISVLSPATMSDAFYKMGNNGVAAWYMETAYQKSGSPDHLKKTITRSLEASNFKKVEKYADIMRGREDFAEICADEDAANYKEGDSGHALAYEKYYDYIYGLLVVSMYENGEEADDIFAECENTVKEGYFDNNAYQRLLLHAAAAQDGDFLGNIKEKLCELRTRFVAENEGSAVIDKDIKLIEELI